MKKLISTLLMGLTLLLFVTSCSQKPTPSPTPKAVDYKNLVGTWKFKPIPEDSPAAKYSQRASKTVFLFYPDKKAEANMDANDETEFYKGTVKENADKTAFILTLEEIDGPLTLRPTDDAKVYTLEFKDSENGQLLKLPLIRINNTPQKP